MGIHGLWPLLESTSTSITLDVLEGKRLAVDISFWLHQAAQGYINNNGGPDSKYPHLTLLIRRIAKLLFYKIRPVFVFDGPDVPVFKRQVLRDRALKRHLDDLLTSDKNQKKMLEQIARINEKDDSFENSQHLLNAIVSPAKKPRRSEDEDLFMLPSTSFSNIKSDLDENVKNEYNYLDGYESLQTSDARVNFLKDAKEKCRLARLRNDQIPDDSKDFSEFQLKRLINRNRINTQLDVIRKDKLKQSVNISDDKTKMVVVDNQLRSHILFHNEDVQTVDVDKDMREKLIRESLSWPAFLRQVESAKSTDKGIKNKKKESNLDDDDDALQEAILASMAESNGLTDKRFRNLPESGFRVAEQGLYNDNWSSSESEDNDFNTVGKKTNDRIETNNLKPTTSLRRQPLLQDHDYMSDASSSTNSSLQPEALDEDEEEKNEEREDYFLPKNSDKNEGQTKEIEDERSVYVECQTLLTLLGVPYLCAPGEAEAQCVELERLGLVDGIVSDDSDVWLFGANLVYKNMFSHAKHVQEYRSKRIFEALGLSRNEFIQIGMLSGGDYSKGFQKIGIVAALELISEFLTTNDAKLANSTDYSKKLLEKIGEWLRTKPKSLNPNERIDRNDKSFVESKTRISLRKVIETNNDKTFIEAFPSKEVFDAYAAPKINSSNQQFTWNSVNFEKLEEFLLNKIGWLPEKLNQVTHGAFKKWDEFVRQFTRQYQSRIDSFVNRNIIVDTNTLAPTYRVKMALAKLKDIKEAGPSSNNNDEFSDEAEMDLQIIRDSSCPTKNSEYAMEKAKFTTNASDDRSNNMAGTFAKKRASGSTISKKAVKSTAKSAVTSNKKKKKK